MLGENGTHGSAANFESEYLKVKNNEPWWLKGELEVGSDIVTSISV